jgi:hypothetical protein
VQKILARVPSCNWLTSAQNAVKGLMARSEEAQRHLPCLVHYEAAPCSTDTLRVTTRKHNGTEVNLLIIGLVIPVIVFLIPNLSDFTRKRSKLQGG